MYNWSIEKIYNKHIRAVGNIPQPRHIIREFTKKLSRKELATLIAAQDINLRPGTSSKDVRLQPISSYDPVQFKQDLEKAGLKILKIVKPGQEGSTSGQLLTYIVQDEGGHEYPVVLGKGKGFSTQIEDVTLEDLREQLESILLLNDTDHIVLDIDGYLQKVNGIKTTPGFPKSDFYFTYKDKPVIFISHKAGTKSTDFQQYSGISDKAGLQISQHPEVVDFVNTIIDKYKDGMKPGESVLRKIQDEQLKKKALFGVDYEERGPDSNPTKQFGINNVNGIYQGYMKIIPKHDNIYTLSASHIIYNGEMPVDGYEPVLFARYGGVDRVSKVVKGMRALIMPKASLRRAIEI